MNKFVNRLALSLAVLAMPAGLWWNAVGNPADYLNSDVPDGQLLYVLSKLAGLIALSFMGFQIVLICSGRLAFLIGWKNKHHRILGSAFIVLASVHVGLFVAAASARSGHLVLKLFVPRLFQGFYDFMVTIGLLGAWLFFAASVVGYLCHKSLVKHRLRHYHGILISLGALSVIIHSYAIGSDTNSLPMLMFYTLLLIATVWIVGRLALKRFSF